MSTYTTHNYEDRNDTPPKRYVMVDLTDLRHRYEHLYELYKRAVSDAGQIPVSDHGKFTHRMFFQLLYYSMGYYDHDDFYQYCRWSMIDSDYLDDFLMDVEVTTQEYFTDIYGDYYRWCSDMAFYREPHIRDPMIVVFLSKALYDFIKPEGTDIDFPWYCYGINHKHDGWR